jgi:hypothetical protein
VNVYPRETIEFLPLTVTDGDDPVTTFEVAVTAYGARPTTWEANTEVGGEHGVMVEGLSPGDYSLWAKVTANPETPVIHLGIISIT